MIITLLKRTTTNKGRIVHDAAKLRNGVEVEIASFPQTEPRKCIDVKAGGRLVMCFNANEARMMAYVLSEYADHIEPGQGE